MKVENSLLLQMCPVLDAVSLNTQEENTEVKTLEQIKEICQLHCQKKLLNKRIQAKDLL